jgi:hypothetical protein
MDAAITVARGMVGPWVRSPPDYSFGDAPTPDGQYVSYEKRTKNRSTDYD